MVFQKLSIVFKVNFFRFSHELDTKESREEGGGYNTIKEILSSTFHIKRIKRISNKRISNAVFLTGVP